METRQRKHGDELGEREDEATNNETLSDIEDAFGSEENTPEDEEDLPSPDGSFDEDDERTQTDPL